MESKPVSYILSEYFSEYKDTIMEMFAERVSKDPKGSIYCIDGEVNDTIYYLLEGSVKIYTINDSGYERIVGYHRANTIFAMGGLIGGVSRVTAQSITPATVIPLQEENLLAINQKSPDFLLKLAQYYAVVLRLMCFDAENQSNDSVYLRFLHFLELYAYTDGQKPVLHMSQEEIASILNCSRVQLTRVCTNLKKTGVISTGRCMIIIENPGMLSQLIEKEQRQ